MNPLPLDRLVYGGLSSSRGSSKTRLRSYPELLQQAGVSHRRLDDLLRHLRSFQVTPTLNQRRFAAELVEVSPSTDTRRFALMVLAAHPTSLAMQTLERKLFSRSDVPSESGDRNAALDERQVAAEALFACMVENPAIQSDVECLLSSLPTTATPSLRTHCERLLRWSKAGERARKHLHASFFYGLLLEDGPATHFRQQKELIEEMATSPSRTLRSQAAFLRTKEIPLLTISFALKGRWNGRSIELPLRDEAARFWPLEHIVRGHETRHAQDDHATQLSQFDGLQRESQAIRASLGAEENAFFDSVTILGELGGVPTADFREWPIGAKHLEWLEVLNAHGEGALRKELRRALWGPDSGFKYIGQARERWHRWVQYQGAAKNLTF